MNNKIWLSSPHMGGNEIKFVQDAFDTNWIAPLGPYVDGLEKVLQLFTGLANAVTFNNGVIIGNSAVIEKPLSSKCQRVRKLLRNTRLGLTIGISWRTVA